VETFDKADLPLGHAFPCGCGAQSTVPAVHRELEISVLT
jgi:hypothetical protein